jgi:uncharacterized protein
MKIHLGKTTIGFLLLLTGLTGKTQSTLYNYPKTAVPIKDVVLEDNFWLPKIKTIQDTTVHYALNKCKSEGRMENFLIAGGKMQGKVRGKMPFDDTDLYKIIEGASYTLISKPNPLLDATLDSVISIIRIGQEPDGYLTTWFTIDRMNPPAKWVEPSPNRWEAEKKSHELYNSGHLFEAAAAHFRATGKRNFLEIALKNADLLVANFGPDRLKIPPGHEIIETGLVQLFQITKNVKYLELAKFYLDQRGDSTSHKLFGDYSQDHLSVTRQDQAVGHAVRAVYLYAGMTDIAAICHDAAYRKAIDKIWNNMVTKKMYLTGGIGSRHQQEAFGQDYELPNLTAYNETCAAIGDVSWNHRLFLLTGHAKYYDIIERSLYNGLISGISLDGKNFFYPNPLESDGKYLFNKGACTRSSWFDCSCCPTNLIRFIPSIPGLIYATDQAGLFVNLFASSHASIKVQNSEVQLTQRTDYPWKGEIRISLQTDTKSLFTVRIRIPGWAQNEVLPSDLYSYIGKSSGKITLKVNGKTIRPQLKNGYAEITREWTGNDQIELNLPMQIRRVKSNDKLEGNHNLVALEYGPLVYCAEAIDNQKPIAEVTIPRGAKLRIFETRVMEERANLIKVDQAIESSPSNQNNRTIQGSGLTLVPYYLWSNRGVGQMKVWIPEQSPSVKASGKIQ